MTIIITLIVLSYATSVTINIIQNKDYILDQKSGELRTSDGRYVYNESTSKYEYILKFNNCSHNLSECKAFTFKEFSDVFINELSINVYIPTTNRLDCSKYSASLIETISFDIVWTQNFTLY